MVIHEGLTRRDALTRAGVAVGSLGLLGHVAADSGNDTQRVNVGWARPSGRRAAEREAETVHYVFSFDALTIEVSEEGKRNLRRREDIRYVEQDAEMDALGQTLPWGIDRVDAEVAHGNGETGGDDGGDGGDGADDPAGADIAIIDTGIDEDHPDLVDNLGDGMAFLSGIQTTNWDDDNGHGTHCAGIADAIDNTQGVVGVSTEATLHAVKVLSATGVGLTSDVAKGIEWTAEQGYDVGSLSLGGGDSDTLRDACEFAAGKGVFLSAAAGNDGCEGCVTYPAAYPECVAVSATTKSDTLADFSSYGTEVELAAPGEDVYSTYLGGTYETLSGTSMACPHVSGAAGQLMDNGQSRTEARDTLAQEAEDIGLSSAKQGAGLLDVAAALGLDSTDN